MHMPVRLLVAVVAMWCVGAARGESPAAFDRHGIPQEPALDHGSVGSRTAGILPRRVWHWPDAAWTQRGLGARLDVHRGPLGAPRIGVRAQPPQAGHPDIKLFFLALAQDDDTADAALEQIAAQWRDGYAGIIWDMVRVMVPPRRQLSAPIFGGDPTNPNARIGDRSPESEHPSTKTWRRLMDFLEDQTGARFRGDIRRAHQWIWDQPYDPHPQYAFFKGVWYGERDPAFAEFFPPGTESTIRLDEIDWGGVRVNGIPPLEHPASIPAEEADYLEDDHIVFGIAAGGEARAYPKRILAWHEMALDTLGDTELTIVYCTLCGTVIPYDSIADGQQIVFGTSGLLYRSNKLMFDHGTKSLWNTFEGIPVAGPLVGSGVRLTHRSVVTTTWGEWRRMHPQTSVLSLQTGFERDYGEGVAYRDYFSNDRLMFDVPDLDDRLDNKDEVLVMLVEDAQGTRHPLALSVDLLEDHRVHMQEHVGRRFVVVTTAEGANRVYDAGATTFERVLDDSVVIDADGGRWQVTEEALVHTVASGRRALRVAAQRAFWFGWHAQFPDAPLID